MKNFVFGANYNFYEKKEQVEVTTLFIPALDVAEAVKKLVFIVGKPNSKKFALQDIRDY